MRRRYLASTPLRRLRRDRDITQAQLAEIAGISQQAVAGIETGRQKPSWETAYRIAMALGKRPEELFPVAMSITECRRIATALGKRPEDLFQVSEEVTR